MVQMNSPGSGWTNGLSIAPLDAQSGQLVGGSRRTDFASSRTSSANTSARIATPSSRKSGRLTAPVILCGGARLPGDALRGGGGQLADAQARANHDHAEAERHTEKMHDARRRSPGRACGLLRA